ncbi:hypothetical protein [Streptomyces sp. NBC_00859]|uniref:hypothetical protein n=1 Tax=Streptomyces sp. NBC_00859 TaxID=2903682 RepID=UPI0038698A88|nr:hypothetical protein OG584_23805 [Streptomyces sp. NBC_00859]
MNGTARGLGPSVLYARSQGLPLTTYTLLGTAVLAAWAARALHAHLDPGRLVPVVALAPMLAAAAISTGLYEHSAELDRTAARPWWPRRLAALLVPTAFAAASLALAVPGHAQEFGAVAMVRNLLGAVGIGAAAAAVLGARLSWLPVVACLSSVYMAGAPAGRAAAVWAWPVQPETRPGSWAAASLVFLGGTALYTVRGSRGEGSRV